MRKSKTISRKRERHNHYKVTAFGRSINDIEIKHDNLKVFKCDVMEKQDVFKAVEGQDVVIFTFGAPVNNNTLFSVPTLTRDETKNVIQAM